MDPYPFRFLRNLGRTREIATVLLNYGFGDVVERMRLRRYLQWGRRLFSRHPPAPEPELTRVARIRLALESLGPTFIKFGQVMSTRPDLVPPDLIVELEKLQEQVPPFPSATAVALLERELQAPLSKLFCEFDKTPLAAGSLAQVHRAVHHDGTPLAVKIRRPNAPRDIERDLSLMMELAQLAERHLPEAQVFDPIGLVNHFARTIRRELNFAREGHTVDEFRRLFRNDATLYIPKVFWSHTTEAVLTMEFIEGCRVDDLEALEAMHLPRDQIAANGARIFMKQAFELGEFHGDPHPGNIRILPNGTIGLLDFGMVGILDTEKREQLTELFLAVTRQDVRGAEQMVLHLGQPYRPIDDTLLRIDVRDFIANYYGVSLERLRVGNMLSDFVSILSNHGIRCPPDIMLLIRALVTLEGVGRQLDPQFNLATYLKPFVEKVIRERYSPLRLADRFLVDSRRLLQVAHDIPLSAARVVDKLSRDDLRIHFEHGGLEHLITEVDRSSNRLVVGMVMSSLILSSALIIRAGWDVLWFSLPTFILSSLLGVWLIYGIFRSGRL